MIFMHISSIRLCKYSLLTECTKTCGTPRLLNVFCKQSMYDIHSILIVYMASFCLNAWSHQVWNNFLWCLQHDERHEASIWCFQFSNLIHSSFVLVPSFRKLFFRIAHRFSKWLRSGLLPGHSNTVEHSKNSFTTPAVWQGASSLLKHPVTAFKPVDILWKHPILKNLERYCSFLIIPSTKWSLPIPCLLLHPQNMSFT